MNSNKRAPRSLPTRGTFRGAQGLRVQLKHGLAGTKRYADLSAGDALKAFHSSWVGASRCQTKTKSAARAGRAAARRPEKSEREDGAEVAIIAAARSLARTRGRSLSPAKSIPIIAAALLARVRVWATIKIDGDRFFHNGQVEHYDVFAASVTSPCHGRCPSFIDPRLALSIRRLPSTVQESLSDNP